MVCIICAIGLESIFHSKKSFLGRAAPTLRKPWSSGDGSALLCLE